ncbi:GPW/gp25 family protein [Microbacterium sp. NPDC019599]|uniref:GPW/gp25 family protein n=1 Tax=Microbacterium sp. NPDC019599 TaxID=3154690 RepID=UPI0033DF005E
MADVNHPFAFGPDGRTLSPTHSGHVRDLIEQVLFTNPGERINRPEFGSGLQGLVFEPSGSAIAATLQSTVEAALQRWLGDVIVLEAVSARADEGVLEVVVQYVEVRTAERRTDTIRSGGGPS